MAFALLERIRSDGDNSWRCLLAKASRVALLASARHRRLPPMAATHRHRRKSPRELDGTACNVSKISRLLAVAVLRRRRASRDWHGQRHVRASRRVANDGRRGSWVERCGEGRRQPAALRLGSGCGGRRARASIHTPPQRRGCQGVLAGGSRGRSALTAAASEAAPEPGSGSRR